MADPQRLLKEIIGWASSVEASHDEVMRNLALERAGHPRAQDFEPSGQGGSDPTSVNGILPDRAVQEGKRYIAAIERAQKAIREADDISHRHRNGIRPVRQPEDPQDVWCVLHLELDAHEPRYRNELCRSCAERKYQTGDFPTLDDVRHHIKSGRWPRNRIDPKLPPKRVYIAGLENLQAGAATLTEPNERKAV
jgi:hypothetical protein